MKHANKMMLTEHAYFSIRLLVTLPGLMVRDPSVSARHKIKQDSKQSKMIILDLHVFQFRPSWLSSLKLGHRRFRGAITPQVSGFHLLSILSYHGLVAWFSQLAMWLWEIKWVASWNLTNLKNLFVLITHFVEKNECIHHMCLKILDIELFTDTVWQGNYFQLFSNWGIFIIVWFLTSFTWCLARAQPSLVQFSRQEIPQDFYHIHWGVDVVHSKKPPFTGLSMTIQLSLATFKLGVLFWAWNYQSILHNVFFLNLFLMSHIILNMELVIGL